MLKVAILGFGFIGKVHAQSLLRMPEVRVVGVGGCRRERLNSFTLPYDVPFYDTPYKLLDASGADMVVICLPTFLHEEFVVEAAERRMHVFCEKPLALTVAEADRMIEAVSKARVRFMVGQVLRFFPQYAKCRELVNQGKLGDIFFAAASRLSGPPRWADWFRDPRKSGGALFDLQVHDLDYLVHMFGLPQTLFASGIQSESGAWDQVLTLLSYPKIKVWIEATYRMPSSRSFSSALRMMGTKGSLESRFDAATNVDDLAKSRGEIVFYPEAGPAVPVPFEDVDPYFAELKCFIDAVSSGREPQVVSFEEVRNVIALLEMAKESLESGKVMSVRRSTILV